MEPIETAHAFATALSTADHHLRTRSALRTLVQYEIDVIKAYEHGLRHISDPDIIAMWSRAKADNERHVLELSEIMRALGEAPPLFRSDARGLAMDAVAEITGRMSPARALRSAARLAQRLARRYERVMDWDLPLEVVANLQVNEADLRAHEARFLRWVKRMETDSAILR